jgi:hypothetical protein
VLELPASSAQITPAEEVMAVTSKVLTNKAATQVEKVRKSGAVMSISLDCGREGQ